MHGMCAQAFLSCFIAKSGLLCGMTEILAQACSLRSAVEFACSSYFAHSEGTTALWSCVFLCSSFHSRGLGQFWHFRTFYQALLLGRIFRRFSSWAPHVNPWTDRLMETYREWCEWSYGIIEHTTSFSRDVWSLACHDAQHLDFACGDDSQSSYSRLGQFW